MNIENKRQFIAIVLAVLLGLGAAFLMGNHIENSVKQQTAMLAQDYQQKSGALINEIEMLKRDLQQVHANTQQAIAMVQQQQQQQQRTQTVQAAPEQPRALLALKIPQGKRAVTILIDSLSAVGGLISAGDFVDILAQLNIPDTKAPSSGTHKVTSVLFQNIQVLAINANLVGTSVEGYELQQRSGSLNITLAMSPDEAGLLSFAQQYGRMQMTLRSVNEQETKVLEVASWDALADYVLQKQGTDLIVPKSKADIQSVEGREGGADEVKPFIQIFKWGKEL